MASTYGGRGPGRAMLSLVYLCVCCTVIVSVSSKRVRYHGRVFDISVHPHHGHSRNEVLEAGSPHISNHNHHLHHHPNDHHHSKHQQDVQTLDIPGGSAPLQVPPHIVALQVRAEDEHVRHKRAVTDVQLGPISVVENTSNRLLTSLANVPAITFPLQRTYVLNSTSPSSAASVIEVNSTGEVYRKEGASLDFETMPSIVLVIYATHSSNSSDVVAITLTINVTNANEPARFVTVPTPYLATVSRNTGSAVTVATLTAIDPDTGASERIEYSLFSMVPDYNSRFMLVTSDPVTDSQYGRVRRCRIVTLETQPFTPEGQEINITIRALDSQDSDTTRAATAIVQVRIGVRPPQFHSSSYVGVIDENSQAQQMVSTDATLQTPLQVRVKTFQEGGTVTFSLLDDTGSSSTKFSIDSEGYIRSLQTFDFEDLNGRTTEPLTVVATQFITGAQLSSNTSVLISIKDSNDNKPIFESSQYESTVSEDSPVDRSVLQVKATDADSGLNARIDYTLSGTDHFYIETVQQAGGGYIGVVKIKQRLDYDRTPGHAYSFKVVATDRGATKESSESSIRIAVTNINDERPEFTIAAGKTFSLLESAPVNQVVTQIQATDLDGDVVRYYFTPNSGTRAKFTIDQMTGLLTLNTAITSTDDSFLLNITARDDGSCCGGTTQLSSETYIIVQVTDVNTHKPNFNDCSSYSTATVTEELPIGTSVLTVHAQDDDRGPNGRVTYSIVSPVDLFAINPSNGTITVASRIDREVIKFIQVTVKGEDGGDPVKLDGLCSFRITVEDINDNTPIFDRLQYVANITSDLQIQQTVVVVKATDMDVGQNAEIQYSLTDDASGAFNITSSSGYVYLAKSLTQGTTVYQLRAMAKDKGAPPRNSTVGITVNIKSGSSKPPEWIGNPQSGNYEVSEMLGEGQVVIPGMRCNSSVADPRVEFQLIKADGTSAQRSEFFSIRSSGNSVDVLSTGSFDYEKATQHTLRIRCLNFGPVTLVTEIQPIIRLRDENNKVPQFEGTNTFSRYEGSVPENQTVGQDVLVITGRDDDHTSVFNELTFSITDEYQGSNNPDFEIVRQSAQKAVVRTKRVFDREVQPYYAIAVMAIDGAPSALPGTKPGHNNSTVTVEIKISDINDNPPNFNQTTYNINVNEDYYLNTPIEPPITATDPDSSDQGRLQYLIVSGNDRNTFGVRAGTGALFLVRRLDYEGSPPDRQFTLRLRASDGLYSAETTVVVTVRDVNDNPPNFVNDNQVVGNVVEEDDSVTASNRKLLVRMNATDADVDRNNQIEYDLQGYGTGENGGPTYFTIDRYTGELYLISKLDRDAPKGRASYVVTVRAADEPGNDPLYGFASVHVNPLDINDNDPYFVTDPLVGTVMEGSVAGSSVVYIRADDPDYMENGTVSYSIGRIYNDQGEKPNYFTIDTTGLIKTNVPGTSLDRETEPIYYLVLRLRDGGNPSRSATGTVTINLGDINDNVPVFQPPYIYKQSIPENYPLNVEIVAVSATDKDLNPRLFYRLTTDLAFFTINTIENKGSIQLYQKLDYENDNQRFFNLTVTVQDELPSHNATCHVEITVTDFNDNPPIIVPEDVTQSVREDVAPGTLLRNFTATDRDSGDNKEFEFSIDPESNRGRFFFINATTGVVQTRRKLDRETTPFYVLTILAIDKGSPPLTGTATFTVVLIDVNDNYPRFLRDYHPHVQENLDPFPSRPVQEIFAYDPDGPPYGPPFGFAEPRCLDGSTSCPCSAKPSCVEFQFTFDPTGDGNNGTGKVTTSKSFDREKQKYYTIPIVMWDMRGSNGSMAQTGTNTLTVTIADVNDNPQAPGHQDVFVYNYQGLFGPLVIGRVYVTDQDDWDLPDKTFTFVGPEWLKNYFEVKTDSGNIIMKQGVPSNTNVTAYNFQVDVYDQKDKTTVQSTVSVVVHDLSEQAVMSSGAVRLTGTSAEEFIKRTENGRGVSMYDSFRKLMAGKLNAPLENVEIISVMDVGEFTDVRYTAHGSPYYQSSQTDSVVVENKREFENLGLNIAMVPIDACAEEIYEGGCYNFLNITGQPAMVNANGTSFVGVEVFVQPREGCRALLYPDPVECSGDYCHNGGTCHKDDFGVLSCECNAGFDGSRCQQLRHSFDGNGYAMYPTLEQCEDGQTAIEFITTQDNGLILYNGPVAELENDQPSDFIALELVGGYPVLHIDHGSGSTTLRLNAKKLSDGAWHRIDIIRTGRKVEMIQDSCKDAVTSGLSTPDTSNCRVAGVTPGVYSFLNVATLLQLGGRSFRPSYQPNIGTSGFNGCVRNLRHNNMLYDLYYKEVPGRPSGQNGCKREDDICNKKCGENGICSANLQTRTGTCVCKPTWRGDACDTSTTIRDFRGQSYLKWSLAASFNTAQRLAYQMDIHIMFRTRDTDGVLFTTSSDDGNRLMTLEIANGHLRVLYNFGDGQHILGLSHADVSNGQWHVARVQRVMRQVTLKLDNGEGRNYIFSAGATTGPAIIDINNIVYSGSAVSVSGGATTTQRDLVNTCVQDIRLNNLYFPMKTSENSVTQGVDLTGERGVSDGCVRNPTCLPPCVPPKGLCYHLWDIAECRCSPGYHDNAGTCMSDCTPNPCFNDVECTISNGTVVCMCPNLWYGPLCQYYGEPKGDDTFAAGLTGGAIAAIVVAIIVALALVLLAILLLNYVRRRQVEKDKMVVEDDDDFDIRENVMFYDEEGAGEEDQDAFDLEKLSMPHKFSFDDKPVPDDRPDDRPDVGPVLSGRLNDADGDPSAPPYDTLHEFDDEGQGSTAGSLSSLNTTSSDASQDYDYLNEWGPKFAKLADMYGAGQDEPEDM